MTVKVIDLQVLNSLDYCIYHMSLTSSRKCAIRKDAGALWELLRKAVSAKLTGTCREFTGEVRQRLLAHTQMCLDVKCDLREEECECLQKTKTDSHN